MMLIFARCQYESSLAKMSLYRSWWWNTGVVVDKHSDYWIVPQLFKFMWWIIQKQDRFNLASRVSNLRVVHTEAVEVFTGISFVIGLWSAASFSKSSDFSKKQVFSHLPQWCLYINLQPSDFEVWMSNSGHNKRFNFVVLTHIIKIQNVTKPFL